MFSKTHKLLMSYRLWGLSLSLALVLSFLSASHTTLLAQETPLKPDLKITNVVWSGNCKATFITQNVGNGNAVGNFSLKASPLYVAGMNGPQTVTMGPIAGLPAGQSANWVRYTWVVGTMITVQADSLNQIAESNEFNNTSTFPVPVSCRVLLAETPVPTREPK